MQDDDEGKVEEDEEDEDEEDVETRTRRNLVLRGILPPLIARVVALSSA